MLQAAAEGLAYGGLYALLGLGFFLTYGVLRRIDLSYGTVIMASMYLAAMAATAGRLPWAAVLVLALAFAVPIALFVTWIAFVLVRGDARFSMAATLGIWMVIEELVLQGPGRGRGQPVDNPLQNAVVELGPVELRIDHLVLLLVALAISWLVALYLRRTRQGLAIRVVAHDWAVASLLGMAPRAIMVIATLLSTGVGILAGWAFAMSQSGIDLHFGMWATIKGLVILVLGGTERLWSIVAAAFALGMAEKLGTEIVGSGYRDLLGYGLALVLLMGLPRGPAVRRG
jgi:branched-subunit amino acid ABC-type transport system permease component